ncbi:hypothetical protein [Streptomyces sp. ICBB 8177]|uniref:hypothetical protein n=1 Tax=Streptomyces sp. ICBB 8177 TaxID=563922 RepID=UPI000D67DBE4|nr:hypothetical protein [Streptomyces sp. ICBB 8177]PWI43539.1 hypothetical protein CK485_15535 [Streptomyces sp. ICBB 8177]
MEPQLAALATSGATTPVGLMVSDGWAQARRRIAALFGRGDAARAEDAAGELERSRTELTLASDAGDADAVAAIRGEWEADLRRLVRRDPDAVAELRALVEEFGPRVGGVHNEISGSARVTGTVVQAHTVTGLTLPSPRA